MYVDARAVEISIKHTQKIHAWEQIYTRMLRLMGVSIDVIKHKVRDFLNDRPDDKKMLELADSIKKHKGVYAKFAQSLAMSDLNNDCFQQNKPLALKKTMEDLLEYMKTIKDSGIVLEKEPSFFGSVGMVIRGFQNKDSKFPQHLCIKRKYHGLEKRLLSDIKTLTRVCKSINIKDVPLDGYLSEITQVTLNEINFYEEVRLGNQVYDIVRTDPILSYVDVPQNYQHYCNSDTIVMSQVFGQSLAKFIQTNQMDKKKTDSIAKMIATFIFRLQLKHRIIYSDCHWGNFLVQEEKDELRLQVVDFAACVRIQSSIYPQVEIMQCYKNNDYLKFVQLFPLVIPCRPGMNLEQNEQLEMFNHLKKCNRHLIQPYTDFSDKTIYNQMFELQKMPKCIFKLKPESVAYVRSQWLLFNILNKLQASGNFQEMWEMCVHDVKP